MTASLLAALLLGARNRHHRRLRDRSGGNDG
jgi:hypothetical protein